MHRGILELKNNTSILHKNGSFSNKASCGLTALFLKMKIYFCCCNFINKQIKKNSQYRFFILTVYSQYAEPKIFQKMLAVLEMELQIYGHLLKLLLYNIINRAFHSWQCIMGSQDKQNQNIAMCGSKFVTSELLCIEKYLQGFLTVIMSRFLVRPIIVK